MSNAIIWFKRASEEYEKCEEILNQCEKTLNLIKKINPNIAINEEITTTKKTAEDAIWFASSLFPAPNLLELKIPLPIPIVKPIACMIAIREKTIPTAADALVPS